MSPFQRGILRDYRDTFSTPHGKRVLAHLLRTHFEPKPQDALIGAVGVSERRGRQLVIQSILGKLKVSAAERVAIDQEARELFSDQSGDVDDD